MAELEAALGGQWEWHALIPAAWQAAALPEAPAPQLVRVDPTAAARMAPLDLAYAEAGYWTPLVYLLAFGLGWTRLDVGLHRWVAAGMPTQDPVLAAVCRGWGQHVGEFLGWLCQERRGMALAEMLRQHTKARQLDHPLPDVPLRVAHPEVFTWHEGGWDGLHLTGHLQSWLEHDPDPGPEYYVDEDAGPGRQALVAPAYASWRQGLQVIDPMGVEGRSTRVDVVCRSVGWLGTYRWSWQTGGWFRGRHRWHVMGA